MTLKVTGFSSGAATYKIVHDADSITSGAPALNENVTGASGRISSIEITNSAGTHTSYTKFKLTNGTVTVGTTEPDMMLVCGPNTSETYLFPAGLPFAQLTFWTTRDAATSDNTVPNSTVINILCT